MFNKRLFVLAGGFGTRLRNIVSDRPKPLAPIGDTPFLQIQLNHWVNQGAHDFVFLLHHQANQIIDFVLDLESSLPKKCRYRFVTESHPLGTGGAVANAVRQLCQEDSFLVTNADTWLGEGLNKLAKAAVPSIGMIRVADVSRYGSLIVNEKGQVIGFTEKGDYSGNGSINAGLYHLHPNNFTNWNGRAISLEKDIFPILAHEQHLHAVELDSDFIDIGIPADYHRFSHGVESGSVKSI